MFQRLILRAEQLLPSSDWQAMANSCWAVARLQLGQRLVEVTAQQLRLVEPKRFERVKLQEIANISWAFGTMKVMEGPVLISLATMFAEDFPGATTQHLSNMVWSFGRLRSHHRSFLDGLAAEAASRMNHFTAQEAANTSWAFATLRLQHHPLMAAVASRCINAPKDFDSQNVANILWSYGMLAMVRSESLFTALLDRLRSEELGPQSPQSLANTLWAFATLKH